MLHFHRKFSSGVTVYHHHYLKWPWIWLGRCPILLNYYALSSYQCAHTSFAHRISYPPLCSAQSPISLLNFPTSCKGDWSRALQEIPQLNYTLWNMLQPTSRRFLRELDEAPGRNNLQYILQCPYIPAFGNQSLNNKTMLGGNKVHLEQWG